MNKTLKKFIDSKCLLYSGNRKPNRKILIVLVTQPLADRTLKKINLSWFDDQGVHTLYLDLSSLHYKNKKFLEEIHKRNKIKPKNYFAIDSFIDLQYVLKKINKYSLIYMPTKQPGVRLENGKVMFDMLNSNKCKYFFGAQTPAAFFSRSWMNLIWRKYRNLIFKIIYKENPIKVFGSGARDQRFFSKIYKNNYIDIVSNYVIPRIEEKAKNYAVFVEESVISSDDDKLLSHSSCIDTPERYFNYIDDVFSKIEAKTGIKIIIAASGRYYYGDSNYFRGREIIYENTLPLIRNSRFVIGHTSLAIAQAIYSFKPLTILDYEYDRQHRKRRVMKTLAHNTGCLLIPFNYDSPEIPEEKMLMNLSYKQRHLYQKYIQDNLASSEKSIYLKDKIFEMLSEQN